MKAILTVIGKDTMGIVARISNYLFGIGANIEDVSQTILADFFVMIMLVDISKSRLKVSEIAQELDKTGAEIGVSIRIQHEDIFNVMHKI